MKKNHIAIPKPNSKFHKVICKECNEENIVFSHVSTTVTCRSCGNLLAQPTGALAKFHGKVTGSND
ncbi:MAG: 30S ribosomal protein S27e [Thaumarchaeota archaeon]|nr:30S ribosomal protein S27e [Nitrososphaerota archaeon]MCY3976091.1 30S ribosomal protein S27e [Nitrososphaerota archaeon]